MLLASLACAVVQDDWMTFSDPFPIRSATAYGGGVLLATDGGLRMRSKDRNHMWTSSDGLETASFYWVYASKDAVLAISENGIVAALNEDEKGWRVLNRSFVTNGVRMVPDMARVSGNIITVAFENRLAFFDYLSGLYILTINRVGKTSFSVSPIKQIEVHGDSLYVATEESLHVRKMDWKNLKHDTQLVNPDTWDPLPMDLAAVGMAPDTSKSVLVDGKKLGHPALYYKGHSNVKWRFEYDDQVYLVTDDFIGMFDRENRTFVDLSEYGYYKLGEVCELEKTSSGGVVAASPDGFLAYSNGWSWAEPSLARDGSGNSDGAYGARMKVLSNLDDEISLYHVWGMGVMLYAEWGARMFAGFSPGDGTCMDEYYQNYTVAVGSTAAPDNSGFLVATAAQGYYGLMYLTKDGEMSCASQVGSTSIAGPITARFDKNGSDWVVYVGTRDGFTVFSQGGVDIFTIPSPSKNGGRLLNVKENRKSIDGIASRTPIDMAVDEKNKVLWLASVSDVGYMELDQDTIKQPRSIKGLVGAEYTSVDVDVRGGVWIGTTNQGAYRLTRTGLSFDTLSTTHFTSANGLLSDDVADVSIDPVLGMAWFAHPSGVSRYKQDYLRDASSFMTDSAKAEVKGYPNPFRPFVHESFCIDNIDDHASVSIYNRGGKLVKFFSGEEVAGGRAVWDGKIRGGKYAAPGVYHYFVKTSSKVKRGKFIIIH